jgi:hypothetical protein
MSGRVSGKKSAEGINRRNQPQGVGTKGDEVVMTV